MLSLIGIGISCDITIKGIDAARNADEVYFESFTMPFDFENERKKLEKIIGKKIELLEREKVESDFLVKKAMGGKIALLIGGDVFSATTHFTLIKDAMENGIKTQIIHNSSVFSAVAKTGLSLYKFGKTATIAFWRDNYKPTSPLNIIAENKKAGLHTLVLLDLDKKLGYMSAKQGIEQIIEMEKLENLKILDEIFVLSKLGFEGEKISFGNYKEILQKNLGSAPFCLVIPGEMGIVEKEFCEIYRI